MKSSKYRISESNLISHEAGVYQFYDKNNFLLYVGKAKNLKNRVKSYFKKPEDLSLKTRKLVQQINHIEITIVNNEYEALLLENNLIKNNNPKYNILLRDDKTFPYIGIIKERFPRIIPTRDIKNFKGKLYGPFSNVYAMHNILELIKSIFKIRTCNYNLSKASIEAKKFKVCLEYHIKNCKGPCENFQSEEDYNKDIEEVKEILKGNFSEAKRNLKSRMKKLASEYKFEEAHEYKEKIEAIDQYYSKSLVINPDKKKDIDAFAIITSEKSEEDFQKAFVCYLKVQKGMITFTKTVEIEKKLNETKVDLLVFAIIYLREEYDSDAKEIYTNLNFNINSLNVKVHVPIKGDRKKLIDIALKNAYQAKIDYINKKNKIANKYESTLLNIKTDLNLKNIPSHVECFDNSNIQGTTPVSAMVCFMNGKPSKTNYRHYNIKTVIGPNDYASMEEVLERRYYRNITNKDYDIKLPNLIIIDGGKGQLSSAVKILKKLDLYEKVDVLSIAKRLEEIYKPYDPYPIHLNKNSPTLKFIQKLRDEAHRFAITFHKTKRSKKAIVSKLEEIKGIGGKTISLLLNKFGSVSNIQKQDLNTLTKVVGKAKGNFIFKYFKEGLK